MNFSKIQKCSRMRTPRLSRRLPAVRLGYVTEMHWPRGTRQSNTQLWRQNCLYVLSRVDAFWRKTEILLFVTLVTLSSAICNWNENRGLCLTQPATTNIARQRVSRPTHPLPTHTPWACCHWQISTAAGLAHSVERLTAEREVAGSILVIPGTGPVLRVLKITEKWRYCLCVANG